MKYVLMTIAITIGTLNSFFLHKFSNKGLRHTGDVFLFNGLISGIWALLLTSLLITGGFNFHFETLIFGFIYGLILCAFLFFKMQSMSTGPISLATLIGSSAFLIATVFGAIYYKETISVCQYIGMAGILTALFLCINPKKSEEKLSAKWIAYCIAFFVAGGLVGILYKVFGASEVGQDVNEMMLTAAIVSCILFLISGFIFSRVNGDKYPVLPKVALPYLLVAAVTSCIYIRLNIAISPIIPSAVFFPVSNGAMVILSTVLGKIFFEEKLNKLQISGIFIGLLSIVIIGVGDLIISLI